MAPPVTYVDSELELADLASARFSWVGGDYRGRPSFGPELAERLFALEDEPAAYGRELYEAVFSRSSELREGLREAILTAKREKSRLRFRLHLAPGLPEWVHALYWELLTDPDRHLALARSPDTAFSRYLEVRQEQGAPARERPRLLCVVAAPSDVARYGMAEIHRDEVLGSLEACFGVLVDNVEVAFLDPPVTLGRLRDRLMESSGVQLLHIFGHGQSRSGISALVLEDEKGRAHFVAEELLAEVFLGVHELRLVTLVACHGGAPSSRDPFSGLAGRLVQRGLPAVIGMRRAVSVDNALLFTRHFYRHIPRTGRADAAVNEARQQLYLAEPRGIGWSSPVLYSRLSDGRLWLPQTEGEDLEALAAADATHLRISLRRLLLGLPTFFALCLFVVGLRPASRADVRFAGHVSQIVVWLEQRTSVAEDLVNLIASQLAAWRRLGDDDETDEFPSGGHGSDVQVILPTARPPAPPTDTRFDLPDRGESVRTADSSEALEEAVSLQPNPLAPTSENGATEFEAISERSAPDSYSGDRPIDKVDLVAASPAAPREEVYEPDHLLDEKDEPSEGDAFDAATESMAPASEGPLCDPSLGVDSKSPMGYRMRGDRCEGIYAQQVSAVSVEVRSLVAGFASFDPDRVQELELSWTAPSGATRDVQLRAFSFKPRTYYRMDTKVPAARKSYRWPTDVLASVELGRDDLGLVAWTSLPGFRTVYLPLRVGGSAKAKDGYEVSLMPSKNLSEVRVTVSRLDAEGNPVATLRKNEELGYGYYPSDVPTVFTTGKLGPAGVYRVAITAVPKSGLSVEQDLELYHAGD